MMRPSVIANGRPRLASAFAAALRCFSLSFSRLASAALRSSAFDGIADMRRMSPAARTRRAMPFSRTGVNRSAERCTGLTRTTSKAKCEAANAVEALDPGVPYESRWAPYVRVHGPGQGQFPKGSIRPRGYMAPDARRSLAERNVAMMRADRQRRGG